MPYNFENHIFVWGALIESWWCVNSDAWCPGGYTTLRFTRWPTGIAPSFHLSIQAEGGGDVCSIEVTQSRLAARNQVFHPNSCWESSIERYRWKSTYSSWLQNLTPGNKDKKCLRGIATSTVLCGTACSVDLFHKVSSAYFICKCFSFLTASSKVQ